MITSADVALKGLVHLLEALAKLRTERPVRLTVVGTARPGGPAEAALDRLALRDAVRFTGPVPEKELVGLLQRTADWYAEVLDRQAVGGRAFGGRPC